MTASSFATAQTSQEQLDDLVLELLAAQGQWEEDAYIWLADKANRLIEFTDGYIEVLPMPTDDHQLLSQYLLLDFLAVLRPRGGVIQYAPLKLRIRARKYREPDLLLLLDASDQRRGKRHWTGADLVVEIVSPDNPARDLVEKRRDYAEARIREYWIVNPLDETVVVLQLQGNDYQVHGIFGRGTRATSALLPAFGVDVAALFDAA
jgi:Uma2 family endonuclease